MRTDSKNNSRLEILRILKKEKCTVEELAGKLDITASAIRQHLGILEKDALIARETMREGTGRPRFKYFTTERADALFPKQYDFLAEMMAAQIVEMGGEERLKTSCHAIGARLFEAYEPSLEGRGMRGRVMAAAAFFNERGGEAYVEEYSGNFCLKEYNCPFETVSLKFPAICEVCTTFLHLSLGEKVRIKRSTHSPHVCLYDIRRD